MNNVKARTQKTGAGRSTLREVARLAGVNQATASVALNGSKGNTVVSVATRERIARAAEELGYSPNLHAQRLAKGGCLNTIALVPAIIDAGTHSRMLMAIKNRLSESGYSVPIYVRGSILRDENAISELLQTVCQQEPRAIVCSMGDTRDHLLRYQKAGGIVVLYEANMATSQSGPFDSVDFDIAGGIEAAARHLLELGHRKLGFFNGGTEKWGCEWMHGFGRALGEFGLEVRSDWRFCGGDPWFALEEGGASLAAQWLAFSPDDRPTGLCIVNDQAAVTFIAAVERAGLQVPRDVSVVGFDDLPIARLNRLPITTVTKPLRDIAQRTVELLNGRLQGHDTSPPHRVIVQGELQVRDSTGPP